MVGSHGDAQTIETLQLRVDAAIAEKHDAVVEEDVALAQVADLSTRLASLQLQHDEAMSKMQMHGD